MPPEPDPNQSQSLPAMLLRGARNRCPVCGQAPLFTGWLRIDRDCAACGTKLSRLRADDAPPYFVIAITGHIVVLSMLWLQQACAPPVWVQGAIFLPMTVVLCLALLRPVKGAVAGMMLRFGVGSGDAAISDTDV